MTGVPGFCKAGATGRLLIEVQVELLGRWALLRHEVGPPDGYSGVPAMSRAAPARPLRLGFSPLSRRPWRSLDRLPYISIPVTLARHIEPNQVRPNATGAPTNATVPAVWLSVKVNGIARNQTTAKTAAGTALAADIFWNGVLKIAFRLAIVESNWLVRLVTALKCACSMRRVGGRPVCVLPSNSRYRSLNSWSV